MATPTLPPEVPISPSKWTSHGSNHEPADISEDREHDPINSEPLNGEDSINGLQDRAPESFGGEGAKGMPPRNGVHREKQINVRFKLRSCRDRVFNLLVAE